MAKRPQATVRLLAWKQHCCVHCGSTFRYQARQMTTAAGDTKEASATQARIWGEKALARQVCRLPCPACGAYQPDRVSRRRVGYHLLIMVLVLIVATHTVMGLIGVHLASRNVIAWVARLTGLFALLGHIWTVWDDPNRNPAVHYKRDVFDAAKAKLEVVPTAHPGDTPLESHSRPTGWVRFGLLMFALGTVLLGLPEAVRVLNAWPLNPRWDPPVAGREVPCNRLFPVREPHRQGTGAQLP